jgi:hypothetical protein
MSLRSACFAFFIAAGCSSTGPRGLPSSSGSPTGSGPSQVVAFSHATNLIPAEVTVDGETAILAVDTGSPIVLLNPSDYASAPANDTVGDVAELSVGSTTFHNVQVVGSNALASPDPAVALGGLLGCTIICGGSASFNYRDGVFALGDASVPMGVMAAATVPFSLMGGRTVSLGTTSVTLPKSRIVVSVLIEGAPHTMIVDTGASFVTLLSSTFSALTSDGRATLPAGMVETVAGVSTATMARTKTMTVGGVEVDGVVVVDDPATDTFFQGVSQEVGETIEGSLGGTFLHDFYMTIDYPKQSLSFARFADLSWAIDPGTRLGFSLASSTASAGAYTVSSVVSGSDAAAKGVRAGDTVVAIDGTTLSSVTISELLGLVSGAAGTTKAVQFGPGQSLAGMTVDIQVSDLL